MARSISHIKQIIFFSMIRRRKEKSSLAEDKYEELSKRWQYVNPRELSGIYEV